jgi:flagellar hook-basal body complex protein FliE
MSNPIQPVSPVSIPELTGAAARKSGGFAEALSAAVSEVEASGRDASQSIERFLRGEGEELHTTAMAAQRAEMAFELFLQARNKVVQAYQEVMRMPM